MFAFFAQAGADPFAGWFTAVIQAGSFGLLTVIVVILAPKMSREAREERNTRDKDWREERQNRDAQFLAALTSVQTGFAERNRLLADTINNQTRTLVEALKDGIDKIEDAQKSRKT